ncbi:MAG: RNA polymerase sigma factor [Acidobacteria bacterium]|nr:RNA polymerase sigma factor [Acidobacteriota bacterium]
MSLATFDEKLNFPVMATAVADGSLPIPLEAHQDDVLVEAVLKGQTHHFDALVEKHFPRVARIARHFFRSTELTEDIVQDTFAKAFFSLHTYRQGASFEHWLARIAVNNCYDELRRKKKRNEVFISDVTEEEGTWLDNKLVESSATVSLTPEDAQITEAVTERLLAGLAAEERVIITLLHLQDYSVKEISQMLGWSEAKVKIRAFRARHSLRRALKRLTLTDQRLAQKGR